MVLILMSNNHGANVTMGVTNLFNVMRNGAKTVSDRIGIFR